MKQQGKKGQEINPDLSQYLNETDPTAVEIKDEDYQIYSEMGSTFQLYKVVFFYFSPLIYS